MNKTSIKVIAAIITILFLGYSSTLELKIMSAGAFFYLLPILFLGFIYTSDRKEMSQIRDLFETFILVLGIDIFARYILIPIKAWNSMDSFKISSMGHRNK